MIKNNIIGTLIFQKLNQQQVVPVVRYFMVIISFTMRWVIYYMIKIIICIIFPEFWTRGLVKKSLNLTNRYDQTNPPEIFA